MMKTMRCFKFTLTHFWPILPFGFLVFSGEDIRWEHWPEMEKSVDIVVIKDETLVKPI